MVCIASMVTASSTNSFSAECIYKRRWLPRPTSIGGKSGQTPGAAPVGLGQTVKAGDDDAKLVFGTVFSLRNMVRKLGGEDDK
jgi:hypothetical protein